MLDITLIGSALLIGLFGSGHCLGMCGGIAAALHHPTAHTLQKRFALSCNYNAGRISGYALLGAAAGGFGFLIGHMIDLSFWTQFLRTLTGLLLIGIGLQLGLRWHTLKWLENSGARVWKKIAPLAQRLLPLRNWRDALLLGLLWGWLPCGLVYSTLAMAATTNSAIEGALVMLSFGLGTLPSMLSASMFAMQLQRSLQNRGLRILSGALIMLCGLWTLWAVWSTSHHHIH